jgi:hypothetical protein
VVLVVCYASAVLLNSWCSSTPARWQQACSKTHTTSGNNPRLTSGTVQVNAAPVRVPHQAHTAATARLSRGVSLGIAITCARP